jgi:peptidoglycan/xylan/chitin deacetylase (PgdA/CDA1 family)
MTKKITIVMYHFVRDLKRSRFPEIKGLDVEDFVGQIDYIRKHYLPISMEQVIDAVGSRSSEWPPNAILLTFDDGYIDHFENVLPVLERYRLQGAFFPSARAILEHRVLDVNKIHFVLAAVADTAQIVEVIFSEIKDNVATFGLEAPESYYERLAVPNRYDTAQVVFIKRVLQRALPEKLRSRVVDTLFSRFVTGDESEFAAGLYMSPDQLMHMRGRGMHIGSHGYDHYWLDTLSAEEQAREIDLSLRFLDDLGCNLQNWTMCYPYGAYDDSLLAVLRSRKCAVGLTTEVAIADLSAGNPLTLPRLDTNDLAKREDAPADQWTILAQPRD